MTTALKEWSAVVHALLDGRQTVLLRKGGIHEKRFALTDSRFLLFPTAVHGHAERVRPEHRDLMERAASDSTEAEVVVRAGAEVVAAIEVYRPEALEAIAGLHIWTAKSIREDRLDFRPKHRLTALVVRAYPLVTPARIRRGDEHRGCSSWVQLEVEPQWAAPVRTESALTEVAQLVRESVGA
ncbi:DUF1802 family protein [Mycobacteroides saopaulense]|uniref:DUF1802 domain-containing protein n=1 Tax=Mycobacteroides saopaulense TaxID=1578165 RepID=A0ABX3C142_9MYCO|nr:DUF1802 family protein [Mycobacteroides saopaulense]OHT82680.1 hypothetical protein BKG68_19165 [Mycobacteroides saopaulense]OHU10223.1 hypothetical protein BKG73_09970 [Mycobacteroides saopaulense]